MTCLHALQSSVGEKISDTMPNEIIVYADGEMLIAQDNRTQLFYGYCEDTPDNLRKVQEKAHTSGLQIPQPTESKCKDWWIQICLFKGNLQQNIADMRGILA